jgi:hypothetical protein
MPNPTAARSATPEPAAPTSVAPTPGTPKSPTPRLPRLLALACATGLAALPVTASPAAAASVGGVDCAAHVDGVGAAVPSVVDCVPQASLN